MNYIKQIVAHITKAQDIAKKHGLRNLLQPGLVKELIIADLLGHEVHKTKHEPDAHDPNDSSRKFEYLSCFEGGTFQFDRMFKAPVKKRSKSLARIARNSEIYCAVFERANPLTVLVVLKVPTRAMLKEASRKLDASRNDISHLSFTIRWAGENGKVVYKKSP